MSCVNQNAFFTGGGSQNFIKSYQGEFVAVSGANMMERLNLSDLRIPYNQVLKSRIIMKAGQLNYLLNFLGLGDNATFLLIKVTYDPLSKSETNNYLQYSYYSDQSKIYTFSSMLMLTGNSENRIEQLYLSNPNPDRQVILEVMCAIIDDNYTYFEDTTVSNNTNPTFNNLMGNYVITWKFNEVIAVMNEYQIPILYLNIADINSWERQGTIVVVDDSSAGSIYLNFVSEYEAKQGASNIAWIIETGGQEGVVIPSDNTAPVVWFTSNIFNFGTNVNAVYTVDGNIYEATQVSLASFTLIGSDYVISKLDLAKHIIYRFSCGSPILNSNNATTGKFCDSCNPNTVAATFYNQGCFRIYDNRDGLLSINETSITIKKEGAEYVDIRTIGLYTITFNIEDLAGNKMNSNIQVKINVIN